MNEVELIELGEVSEETKGVQIPWASEEIDPPFQYQPIPCCAA